VGVISLANNTPCTAGQPNMSPFAAWVLLIVVVAVYAVISITRTARRRSAGSHDPPLSITILGIVVAGVAGAALGSSAT